MPKRIPNKPSPQAAIVMLNRIHALYDGREVNSQTHYRVAEALRDAGYLVRQPHEVEECDECEEMIDTTLDFMSNKQHAKHCSKYNKRGK